MPAPLDPDKRDAIEQDVRTGQKSRNQIARDHHVSASTITKIARQMEAQGDLDTPAFDRSHTKRATEARQTDLAARRAELASLLLDDAFRFHEKQWEPQAMAFVVAVKGGGARTEVVEVPASAADHRNYMTSIGIAVDKVRILSEGEDGIAKAASLLEQLMDVVDAK